jgi:hypothetical protein
MGTSFFSLALSKCKSCSSDPSLRAKLTLVSPAGLDFDLYVYSDSSCSTQVGSATTGGAGGTETVTYSSNNACQNGSATLYAKVVYKSGSACGSWSLSAQTAY